MKLETLLPESRIALSVEAADWTSAVRAAGRLLVDTGAAEERYIEGMIRTVKELGPYIVIAPGIAIPHARPEDGVLQPALAFLSLATPVNFGNKENDPVRILFALAAADHEQHTGALQQIAEILMEEKQFHALLSVQSVKEVQDLLY